ncbi:MAG: hypothetical protein R3E01_06715 [Pirellulaceae bacterium]
MNKDECAERCRKRRQKEEAEEEELTIKDGLAHGVDLRPLLEENKKHGILDGLVESFTSEHYQNNGQDGPCGAHCHIMAHWVYYNLEDGKKLKLVSHNLYANYHNLVEFFPWLFGLKNQNCIKVVIIGDDGLAVDGAESFYLDNGFIGGSNHIISKDDAEFFVGPDGYDHPIGNPYINMQP